MTNSTLSDETKELAAGYVLDELEPSEIELVERMMLENPALRQEVRELQMVLGGLTLDVPQLQPPAHLRAKVLQSSDIDGRVVAVPPKKRNWSMVVAISALIAAAALLLDNLQLRQDLNFARQQTPERLASLLQRPNSKLVALTAQTTGASGGTVLFTPGKWQEVVVSVKNLPPLPANQVYRLWLTLNNQQTIYCGEFRTDGRGNASQSINPPQVPPPGTKATGLFVTVDRENAPALPTGTRIISGEI
ncbi:anti-sigma factor [Chamaesiphon sp. VAR_48_metabat_403]|uniref:anti-sigma factor n=1 Tax=Chamaesiphon sp. VAR_48_metabat_403 TaxID=2964700 RepID=UPI00286E05FC|nr:anti-sigma factor [Chamaesiphon sp. VAR_48_metabat_403]